jgi:mannose-1-phosphate guanylyltransferase
MAIGILLVGGLGSRLAPLTNEIPKPMLPVGGLPVTEHQLMAAKAAGITTVILATSYLSEVFIPYFGDGSQWGMKLLYAVEKEPLGTGGAIRNAAEVLSAEQRRGETFVIFNGDVLSKHDISAQLRFHQTKGAEVTMHLIDVADARAFGCVPTDGDGRVTDFLEKMENPVTNSINAGCYVFSSTIIEEIPLGKVVSIERETFPHLVETGRAIYGYHEESYWLDVGTPAALFKGSRDLVAAEYLAGAGTTIGAGTLITGGSAIGRNCSIGVGVSIHDCIIGDGVHIGDGAKISHSFISHGAQVEKNLVFERTFHSSHQTLPISLP